MKVIAKTNQTQIQNILVQHGFQEVTKGLYLIEREASTPRFLFPLEDALTEQRIEFATSAFFQSELPEGIFAAWIFEDCGRTDRDELLDEIETLLNNNNAKKTRRSIMKRHELETRAKITTVYHNLGISEAYLRSPKTRTDADNAEVEIREESYKGIQEALSGPDTILAAFWGHVQDRAKSTPTAEYIQKAQRRANGDDARLADLLNTLVDAYLDADQEIGEKLSEIVNDYFLNFATPGQKDFIASDLMEMWQEKEEGF